MDIEHTARGFALTRFGDLAGCKCSIQDSSIASEACIWFGVSKDEHGEDGERMHLTQRMALRVARLMRTYADTAATDLHAIFTDRNGSECTLTVSDGGILLLGVVGTRDEPGNISLMMLDQALCAQLAGPLLAFVGGGTVESDEPHDLDAVNVDPVLDVKVPPSMLGRTDVGETGVSAAELVGTLLDLLDGEDLDSLRSTYGHDRGEDLHALHARLKPLRGD